MATSVENPSASDASPTMAADYQDFDSLDVVADESGRRLGRVFPPPQSRCQRTCPTNRLVLMLLLFCGILVILVSVLGYQGVWFQENQWSTQEVLKSLNKTVWGAIGGLQHMRNSSERRLAELEKTLSDHNKRMETAKNRLQDQLGLLQEDARVINCDLVEMRSNGTKSGCCPKNWRFFQESCYWFSKGMATWDGAKQNCERSRSHLVIINSAPEKVFLSQHRRSGLTWIGLSDIHGDWRWVDGSSYTLDKNDWEPGQPDHWYGHRLGGGEDCVQMLSSGRWNDNHCSRNFLWICEMELKM